MEKKHYIRPNIDNVQLPLPTLMTSLSISGTEGGEARSNRFNVNSILDEGTESNEKESLF